jgi:hypothetical protein
MPYLRRGCHQLDHLVNGIYLHGYAIPNNYRTCQANRRGQVNLTFRFMYAI